VLVSHVVVVDVAPVVVGVFVAVASGKFRL
jgi:hypothetical protein